MSPFHRKCLCLMAYALVATFGIQAQSLSIAGQTFSIGMSRTDAEIAAKRAGVQFTSGPGMLYFWRSGASLGFNDDDRIDLVLRPVESFQPSAAAVDVLRTAYALLANARQRFRIDPVVSLETRRVPNVATREITKYHFGSYFVQVSVDQGYGSTPTEPIVKIEEGVMDHAIP